MLGSGCGYQSAPHYHALACWHGLLSWQGASQLVEVPGWIWIVTLKIPQDQLDGPFIFYLVPCQACFQQLRYKRK